MLHQKNISSDHINDAFIGILGFNIILTKIPKTFLPKTNQIIFIDLNCMTGFSVYYQLLKLIFCVFFISCPIYLFFLFFRTEVPSDAIDFRLKIDRAVPSYDLDGQH